MVQAAGATESTKQRHQRNAKKEKVKKGVRGGKGGKRQFDFEQATQKEKSRPGKNGGKWKAEGLDHKSRPGLHKVWGPLNIVKEAKQTVCKGKKNR